MSCTRSVCFFIQEGCFAGADTGSDWLGLLGDASARGTFAPRARPSRASSARLVELGQTCLALASHLQLCGDTTEGALLMERSRQPQLDQVNTERATSVQRAQS